MIRLALVLVLLLAGCSEAPVPTIPVQLQGTITAPAGNPGGKVRVNLYHAWALEGQLRHPLAEIVSFDAATGEFSQQFDYPIEKGEGLVVHAWLDTNEDGVFCTPTVRDELSGLVEVADFPAETVTVNITLTEPCRSAGWFYPPAP